MTTHEHQNNHETKEVLPLKGALTSFEDTPLAPLIKDSLEKAGFNPATYDPKLAGHEEYMGFPATSVPGYERREPVLSPIWTMLESAVEDGTMQIEPVDHTKVRLPSWTMYPGHGKDPFEGNAHRTSKLTSIGMLAFKDVESGEVVGYAPRLGTDGGREGHALISVKDVELLEN